MTGIEMMAAERRRQVEVEKFTPEHDAGHINGELAWAACAFAAPGPIFKIITNIGSRITFSDPFPEWWTSKWDRRAEFRIDAHGLSPLEQRIDLLAKAGALLAAEIDRLKAAEAK